MNRYIWPTFERPKSNHGVAVGQTVKIKNKSIIKSRAYGNIPSSNVGVVVDIDDFQHLSVKIRHSGESSIRNWSWDDIDMEHEQI